MTITVMDLFVYTAYFVLLGVCVGIGATALPDWCAIHRRWAERRTERQIRRRTLRARREIAKVLPRAEAKQREQMRREMLASVLSRGGR